MKKEPLPPEVHQYLDEVHIVLNKEVEHLNIHRDGEIYKVDLPPST